MAHAKFPSARFLILASFAFSTACGQTEEPDLAACYAPIAGAPTRGPKDAWVTVVEFGDFQCSYCGKAESTISQVDIERPGIVRWVWKELPLPTIHPRAVPDATAAECAYSQGLFWEMHDLLFANQAAQSDSDLAAYAQQIGADMPAWQACLSSDVPKQRIAADETEASNARVSGTPTFFVNSVAVVGAAPLDELLSTIDAAQQSAKASGIAAADFYSLHEGQGCL
jgi:protein-disulfide isomerase